MTADDIRKARHDRAANALAEANAKTGLFKRPGTTAVADPYPDQATVAPGHTDLMVSPEAIDAFLNAHPPAPEPAARWLPIDTAPKDGTPVLVRGNALPVTAVWVEEPHYTFGWVFAETNGEPVEVERRGSLTYLQVSGEISEWMPIEGLAAG